MSDISIVPPGKPQMGPHQAEQMIVAAGVTGPALLMRRGYFWDTMRTTGTEGRGIYDDALFLVTPTAFNSFNANGDPSVARKDIARLEAGVWRFKIGVHNASKPSPPHQRYTALVEAEEFTVHRDGTDEYESGHEDPALGLCLGGGKWKGSFGINLHCGSYKSTSSEGCLTVFPDQWEAFIELVKLEMLRHEMLTIPCVVSDREAA